MNISADHRDFAELTLVAIGCWTCGWVMRGWWEKRRRHDGVVGELIEKRSRGKLP